MACWETVLFVIVRSTEREKAFWSSVCPEKTSQGWLLTVSVDRIGVGKG